MKKLILLLTLLLSFPSWAIELGETIPAFTLKDQQQNTVDSNSFKNNWTVLFFYPKAETPGCTKQACAFRDNIKVFNDMGVKIYGISVNSVEDQKKFAEKYNLKFPLLADHEAVVAKLFKVKMPLIDISKRWTFIIGPDLKVRDIGENVDPVLDSQRVIDTLKKLQK